MLGPSLILASLTVGSTLEAVDVRPTETRARIVLAGTAPPNFSAFVEPEPYRVVIDWAGARLGSLPAVQAVDHPDIRQIRLEERVTESEPVTRVSIILERSVTFELRSERTEVWVDLDVDPTRLGARARHDRADAAVAAPSGAVGSPAPTRATLPPEAHGRPLTERVVEVPDVEAAPRIPETELAAQAADDWALPPVEMEPERAAALAEAQAREARLAEARAREERAREIRLARERASEAARAEARAENVQIATAPRAVADPPVRGPSEETSPRPEISPDDSSASGAPREAGARVAAEPAPREVPVSSSAVAPAVLARFRPDPAPTAASVSSKAPSTALAARASAPDLEREPMVRPVVLARFAPGRAAPDTRAAADEGWDPGPHVMTYIGFRQRDGISRVFVRLDGRARFRQYQDRATFVLELVDTSVNVENNERPLDTTYFEGPIANIRARPVDSNTRIEVKLRATAPWQIKRIGNTIAIDFEHADRR
jgi:hypothetical protein